MDQLENIEEKSLRRANLLTDSYLEIETVSDPQICTKRG